MTVRTYRDNGACHPDRIPFNVSHDDFFPFGVDDVNEQKAMKERALAVCAECTVRYDCLEDAVDFGPGVLGVWGGRYITQNDHSLREARKALRLGRV